jgi:chaperone protein PapD
MLAFKKNITKTLLGMACICVVTPSFAAISLDRTRAIFNESERSMTLSIKNDNTLLPYLAQAWLENSLMEKITTGPLIVTPPVQRVEPGKTSLVRVSSTFEVSKLPLDKESVFYFNLREIPPKSDKANALQIALQTKIKLFYRPKAIEAKPNAVWQDQLVLNEIPDGYNVVNPTPYYITVTGLADSKSDIDKGEFPPFMIAPKSELEIQSKHYKRPLISYINDYGGRPILPFECAASRCVVVKK